MVTQRTATDMGVRIADACAEKGISAQRLALATQIPYATMLRRLAGDGRLTVAELDRISDVLEVKPASWFEVAA